MHIDIQRIQQDDQQTLGLLRVVEGGEPVFQCKTIELPWRNNKRRVSRIPTGTYDTVKHNSPQFGASLWLQNVPDRSEILVHRGNYNRDTLGCILVGEDYRDIDGDGKFDVKNSLKCMRELLAAIPVDRLKIHISDYFVSIPQIPEIPFRENEGTL